MTPATAGTSARGWPPAVRRAVPAAAALGLVALLALVLVHPAPLPLDRALHAFAVRHRQGVGPVARFVTTFGTGPVLLPVLLIAGLPLARHTRRWYLVLTGPVLLLLAQLVREALMSAVRRPRPPAGDWFVLARGFSFPSGHTNSSAFGYGLVLLLLAPQLHRTARAALAAAVVLLAGAVGASRVLLGVHWPTDVLAGWSLALILLAAAAAGLAALRRWSGAEPLRV